MTRRVLAIGLARWKAHNLKPILRELGGPVYYVSSAKAAARLMPRVGDWLLFWGAVPPHGVQRLADEIGAGLVRLEDGFIRSVGLGSDLIPPMSLVFDRTGIYFDATCPSDLELLLAEADFNDELLARAAAVREFIVANGLTKYNLEPRVPPRWQAGGRRVILVPGQVETDASIALGGHEVRSNAALLAAVRASAPDAFLVYKPHPDVMSGNRMGRLGEGRALEAADHVETGASITSCIEACDEVHTITSLSGFDALLRGRRVTTYGVPFYAGWGLTTDMAAAAPALERRRRHLSLDQLVAGALLLYPRYWDPERGVFTDCETVLRQIRELRDLAELDGRLERLRRGFAQRQIRKLKTLAQSWFGSSGVA